MQAAGMQLSERAQKRGNRPFGAVLVAENGKVLSEGEPRVGTEQEFAQATMYLP